LLHPAFLVAQATAPVSPDQSDNDKKSEVVTLEAFTVVGTGTEIRGLDPIGTKAMVFDRVKVEESGALNANEFLASIPQTGLFNILPQPTADFGLPITRPNIRGIGNSGASTTLVLMDGHRLVGAGFLETVPDATIIPPGMIERVEILADGGSPLYGSDAVGGVINFITRKNFDGTSLLAHYGIANGYYATDANLTHGWSWKSGSAVVSYAFTKHSNLSGADRDYDTSNQAPNGGNDGRTQNSVPGNIGVNGVNYNPTTFQPGTTLRDSSKFSDLYPAETQNSVYATLTQKFNEVVSLNLSAYWSQRHELILGDQGGISGTINSTNPFFHSITGETSQSVSLSLAPVLGNWTKTPGLYSSMGITAEYIIKLGGDWELRLPLNYGYSINRNDQQGLDQTAVANALAGTTTSTALNPYNLSATNPAVIAAIADHTDLAFGRQELAEFQAIADGTVFKLAGGNAKLAVGGEVQYSALSAHRISGQYNTDQGFASAEASRSSQAAFVEFALPLIGKNNSSALAQSLKVSLSDRFDNYSDFGSTNNPKVGISWVPVSSLSFRANYGTAFVAPSLADTRGGFDTRTGWVPVSPWLPPGAPAGSFFRPTLIMAGSNGNLQPMKGKTWSFGADWTPKAIEGLTVSATYWNAHFTNDIHITPFFDPVLFTNPGFAKYYTINPTEDQLKAILGSQPLVGWPTTNFDQIYASGQAPYLVLDAHRHNFGIVNTDGVDLSVNYYKHTSFGSVHADFNGTKTLKHETTPFEGGITSDDLAYATRFQFSGSAGARFGRLDSTISVKYTGGFPLSGSATQSEIASFHPVDLYFSYDLDKLTSWTRNAKVTLNITNVFDVNPALSNISGNGIGSGGTLGRFAMLGIEKRF
jgi:iron complex outermembrane receptor protein